MDTFAMFLHLLVWHASRDGNVHSRGETKNLRQAVISKEMERETTIVLRKDKIVYSNESTE